MGGLPTASAIVTYRLGPSPRPGVLSDSGRRILMVIPSGSSWCVMQAGMLALTHVCVHPFMY